MRGPSKCSLTRARLVEHVDGGMFIRLVSRSRVPCLIVDGVEQSFPLIVIVDIVEAQSMPSSADFQYDDILRLVSRRITMQACQ